MLADLLRTFAVSTAERAWALEQSKGVLCRPVCPWWGTLVLIPWRMALRDVPDVLHLIRVSRHDHHTLMPFDRCVRVQVEYAYPYFVFLSHGRDSQWTRPLGPDGQYSGEWVLCPGAYAETHELLRPDLGIILDMSRDSGMDI